MTLHQEPEPTGPSMSATEEELTQAAARLEALDEYPRRREIYALIKQLAAAPPGVQDAYRAMIAERKWMTRTDWRDAISIEKKAVAKAERQAASDQKKRGKSGHRTTDQEHPYRIHGGCLYRETEDGTFLVARFVAQITADVTRDDGTERFVMLRVTLTTPSGRVETVDVGAEQVTNVRRWATQALGADAVIPPSPQATDHVWTAAQLLAGDIERTVEYVHTGWRVIDGVHRFLSGTGALGADGLDESVRVELGVDALADYKLIDPTTIDLSTQRAAVRASLDLVNVGPAKVTVPQLAAAYRAVLPLLPDTSVFVVGGSGSLKTAFSAVVLQHFGTAFTGKRLPAEWKSSGNALEGQAHQLANVLFIIDDYAPQNSEDPRRLAASVDRVLRGSANSSGRGRMRPDGTLRPVKPPRAQILTSGEDVPPGQSLRARLTIVEVDGTTYDRAKLTAVQRLGTAGTYVTALSTYIAWLSARRADPDFDTELRARMAVLRNGLQADGQHLRTPEASASLYLGWETFLRCAVDIGALTQQEASQWATTARAALAEQASAQLSYITAADPVQLYISALRAALTAGTAHLADSRTGGPPKRHAACGWRTTTAQGERYSETLSPGGQCIGWITPDGDVYLSPSAAYAVARAGAERAGTPLETAERTMSRRLSEMKKLATTDGKQATVKKPVPAIGDRPRVLWLAKGVLLDVAEDDA